MGISQEQFFWFFPFLIAPCKSRSAAALKTSQHSVLLQIEWEPNQIISSGFPRVSVDAKLALWQDDAKAILSL